MELKARQAPITEGWHEVSVEELKAPAGNALSTGPFGSSIGSRFFRTHGVPVIRGSNLAADGRTHLIDNGFVFVSDAKAHEFRRSVAIRGDLVFTCWGTINQVGLIGPCAAYSRYVISNKQMKFTPDDRKANSLFLFYLFSGPELQRAILEHGIGTSVPGFNLGQLRALRFKVPALPEQRAIAAALSDVDALIGALDQLIAKKRDLKQAAMQQLLTGQTRLPGFSGEWELKRLGAILDYEQPAKFLVKSSDYDDDNDTAVLTANMSFVLGYTNEQEGVCENVPVIIFDDFTTASRYVSFPFKVKSSALKILRLRDTCDDLRFLHWRMQLIRFILGAHKRYWISEFQHVEIAVPLFDEQTAIAAVLSDIDAEIDTLEQRRDKTRALKQGMMQELLTGRTRLV
jgi:type I restriction enzyme S subunit